MLFSLNIKLHIKHSVHSQTETECLHRSCRPKLNAKMVTLYKSFCTSTHQTDVCYSRRNIRGNNTDVYRCHLNARMHLNIARGWGTWTKSISFNILTIRHHLYTFPAQSPVSSLIKKHHSSHLARIQLRDMALKAQPWSLSPSHIKGALSTEPCL